jgi:hypothetical protein
MTIHVVYGIDNTFAPRYYRMVDVASRQNRHTQNRRAKGLCQYGGCPVVTGDKSRCPEHARAHAARMKQARTCEQCQCGATSTDGACLYYKSGRHVLVAA